MKWVDSNNKILNQETTSSEYINNNLDGFNATFNH